MGRPMPGHARAVEMEFKEKEFVLWQYAIK